MTGETLTRSSGKASSFNAAKRTVELVFATEQPVRRRSWEGDVDEILIVNRKAIDASRVDGMALLDGHDAYSGLASRLGSIVPGSLRFEGSTAVVTAKLSRTEKGDQIVRDLEDGMSLPVSVGYRIETHERQEAPSGGVATVRATRWTPLEISIVAIPADSAARTRAHPPKKENRMSPRNRSYSYRQESDEELQQREEEERRQEEAENRRLTLKEGRTFAASLLSIAEEKDIEAPLQALVRRGMTEHEIRSAYLNLLVDREQKSPTFPHSETHGMRDGYQDQLTARQDALVARMTGKSPEGDAREFMNASLMDHARGLLEAQGVNTRGMSREQIVGYRGSRSYAMHTTSDFPLLLQGAGKRVLQQAYTLAQSPLKTVIGRRSTATDFRFKSKLKISDAGLLEKVSESGEITSTTRGEASESYRIDSYGRIFSLSFQAIVNDDLGAFTDWSVQAGRMAALTENKILLDLLLANNGTGPKMGEDAKNLFHADHGNLAAAGTDLDEGNLSAAILAFRKQTIFGGKTRIAIPPRYLLVGPELEVPAQKLLASISPTKTDDAVPGVIASLVAVVEPNLDGTSWRIFADPAQQAVFEWAYLEGHEGPQVDTQEGFERLGTKFRALLHFGAGALDFRGAYLNPGVV